VKTRSSGDNSAEGGKTNRSINTQTRLRILPPRVFQQNWRVMDIRGVLANV
jgi:hypothetical protein